MSKQEIQRIILVVVVILIVVGVGYFGWLSMPWGSVKSLETEAAKLRTERRDLDQRVKDAEAMVKNLDQVRKDRAQLEAQLSEDSKRLPSESESAQVLRDVEALAGRSGLTVAQVKRRPTRPQELYAELPMEIGVGGGYFDLVKFADQLAKLERLVTLSELVVSRPSPTAPGQPPGAPPPTNGTPTVQAQVVAVVFQVLPEPPAGAAPAAK